MEYSLQVLWCIIVYIYNTITKNRLTGSIKTFGILAVALIILGLQCRTAIFTIDYDTMVYDKTEYLLLSKIL